MNGTSISDTEAYRQFCCSAATDSNVFATFRSHYSCRKVYEHVSEELGLAYLNRILSLGATLELIKLAALNDSIGGPLTMEIATDLRIAPTTLRYLNVAYDLGRHFGSLNGLKICEIGVGYGGLCRILDSMHRLESYTLIDLEPAICLAERYLSNFPLRNKIIPFAMEEVTKGAYDLVISNYALSECTREVQEYYFNTVIDGAPRGYITYNEISPQEFGCLNREEIAQRVQGTMVGEDPRTHPGNCIIVWNRMRLLDLNA